MPYIFGKLWHLAIIWAIRTAFQCILQGVIFLLANHTRLSPTSENDSYTHTRAIEDNLFYPDSRVMIGHNWYSLICILFSFTNPPNTRPNSACHKLHAWLAGLSCSAEHLNPAPGLEFLTQQWAGGPWVTGVGRALLWRHFQRSDWLPGPSLLLIGWACKGGPCASRSTPRNQDDWNELITLI